MIINIDFDDIIVYDAYPEIGELLPYADSIIKHLYSRGHEIIINTCRNGKDLKQVKDFLRYMEIPYNYINENSPRQIALYHSDTRKISCDLNIDDKNLFIQEDFYFNGKDVVQDTLWQQVNNLMQFLEKPLVLCITGESGAGKTMLANYFTYEYGVNLIESYTDRPMRDIDEKGHTFVPPDIMTNILDDREILAYTEFSDYRYCCTYDDIAKVNTYVIDEYGVDMLKKNWSGKLDIYTIRLHRDKEARIKSVGEKRVARDRGKFTKPDDYFDFVIHNPLDDKEHVFSEARKFVKKFRLEQRFTDYVPVFINELEE